MIAFILLSIVALVHADPHQDERRLIMFVGNEDNTTWMPVSEIDKLPLLNIGFMDITEFPVVERKAPQADPFPPSVQHQAVVNPLLSQISEQNIVDVVSEEKGLGKFHNRWYTSEYGKASSEWLFEQYNKIVQGSSRTDIKVEWFRHSNWPQQNIVATIEGTDPQKKDDIVIIGGHQDSTAGGAVPRAPGADDDASGSSTVLETFRVLVAGGFKPKRTIEFHAYAAEEAGLLGSAAMANNYAQNGRKVHSMMQLDMTGFGTRIKLVTDQTDKDLTDFEDKLCDAYLSGTYPCYFARLGGGGSDHMSWTRQGYRASFPFEEPRFGRIHTATDQLKYLDPKRMVELGKLGVSYCVELSLNV